MGKIAIYKITILFILGVVNLYADSEYDYSDAIKFYKNNQYKKAFPIILEEAKDGNKEAQYLIAYMYEKGYGVKKNNQAALSWYKKAASTFKYITKKDSDTSNEEKILELGYSKFSKSDNNVKKERSLLTNNDFGILPYKTNYAIPFSYSTKKYKGYEKNTEIEFQISFLKNITYNLLGMDDVISFAYTQKSFWQAYSESAPFRETNYEPELFITIPTSYIINKKTHIKALQFGFNHQSNGQDGYKSRSWNRLIFTALWQNKNLFLKARTWYRIPEHKKSQAFYEGKDPNAKGDDNPDIEKYLGYGDLDFKYLYKDNLFGLKIRNNLRTENKGAVKFTFSKPIFNKFYGYFQFFNGYGESLITYNQNTTKVGLGIAIYRSLF
jgi:phospholipase A1